MRRRLPLFILLFPWFIFPAAFGQWVNVTAANIKDGSGALLSSGQFCVRPVNNANQPLPSAAAGYGAGAITTQTICAPITSGKLPGYFWPADPSAGGTNLVPDPVIASGFTTWTNPGTGWSISAGTGYDATNALVAASSVGTGAYSHSAAITVTPGTTYTFGGYLNAAHLSSGSIDWYLSSTSLYTYASVSESAGNAGWVTTQWTAPSGVTQVEVVANTNTGVIASGQTVSWSAPLLQVGFSQLADTAVSDPVNFPYRVTILNASGVILYTQAWQPSSGDVSGTGCTTASAVTTCNFDNYVPPGSSLVATAPAPSITVSGVNTLSPGASATVSLAPLPSAPYFGATFNIPQGATGATGATGAAGPNTVTGSTSTTLTGLLKGNGASVGAASSGDVQSAIGSGVYDTSGAAAAAQSAAIAASVNLASTSTQTLNGPLVAPWLNNVPDAGEFSGANVGAQIDNACAALSGSFGVAEVNPLVAGGTGLTFNSQFLAANCALLDWRTQNHQPNQLGQENQAFWGGPLFRARYTTQLAQATIGESVLHLHADVAAGGVSNNTTYQSTGSALFATSRFASIGQGFGIRSQTYTSGLTDTVGVFSLVKAGAQWGATQHETEDAGRFEAQPETNLFTATVATSNTTSGITTLTFSSDVNDYVVGEQRYLYETSGSNAPYTTGTISGISGLTVTGSGTSWSGFCPNGQAFFALDSLAKTTWNGSSLPATLPLIIPVASIASNTSLTLNVQYNGNNSTWPWTSSTTGAYHLYCGEITQTVTFSGAENSGGGSLGNITQLTSCVVPQASDSGSSYTPVNQANAQCSGTATGPFASGDTVAVAPAYNIQGGTVRIIAEHPLWDQGQGAALHVQDDSYASGDTDSWNTAIQIEGGSFVRGIWLGGAASTFIQTYAFYETAGLSSSAAVFGSLAQSNNTQHQWEMEATDSTKGGWSADRVNKIMEPYGGWAWLLQSHGVAQTTCTGTVTINPALGDVECTLTGNVTTVTVTSLLAGTYFTTHLCQNSTGSYTWAWPASFHGGATIGSTASKCTDQAWRVNLAGTVAYAISQGVTNE